MTYNFTRAKEGFPLAVELLMDWLRQKSEAVIVDNVTGELILNNGECPEDIWKGEFSKFDPLNLQFFFDGQGIYGCVEVQLKQPNKISFDFFIRDNKMIHSQSLSSDTSREQAYVALFDKCFEILGKRLQESGQ